ncbi:polyprenyl synthetase family protein [Ileibacterium valens]|uniref:polyprenyl synthetase family protein n=2 Tax=Ileibacterium valens TaxID=1862668 RepID=UPI0009FB3C97|nr:farnesyl diphosphate synthase [Ileibacterium valens]
MIDQNILLAEFDEYLKDRIQELKPSRTRDAMEYSLFGSGKRVRPMLLFRTLESYGLDPRLGFAQAAAIEMIHTYSLIHDDLPAMDNDDFRRGRPSCHKQFGEDIAILAGDGLLTEAFNQALKSDASPKQIIALISLLSDKAGAQGMIYGQELDILSESANSDRNLLHEVQKYKTGCLIELPMLSGAVLANDTDNYPILNQAGEDLGVLFQIQDDILDATKTAQELGKSNSDLRNQKLTAISVDGIEQAQKEVNVLASKIMDSLKQSLPEALPLNSYIEELLKRQK